MHEHASPRQALETMIRSRDLEGLLRHAETIHGHRCPFLALGVKAGQHAMTYLEQESTGMEEVVAIVECNNCFTDGIQVVTGCTFGNNALIYKDLGKTAVTVARRRDGAAVRLVVHPDFRERMFARYPAAEPLFDKVVTRRQGNAEDRHRFHHLWEAVARRELEEVDLADQFLIETLTIPMPADARIFATEVCERCGEGVMEPRIRVQSGQKVCLACAGEEYYILTGQGIGCAREI
ncbi:MAG TPA: FmdE family protein [Desulfobaccales bacterium]|nr:FmdE family protein [Desulfobaccales bacterium]